MIKTRAEKPPAIAAIARADLAEALVEALNHSRASRAAFEVKWGDGENLSFDAVE